MFNIHRNTILIFTTLLLLLLAPISHVYAEGTYFDISFDRSVSITPADGKKKISSIGDSVTLNKKGRLWLTGNETKDGFVEIVCQNLSKEPVNVELTNTETPWVNITAPEQCNDWQKNILICPVGKMDKGVFCKITERTTISSGEGSKKQKTASVNVRSVTVQEDRPKGMNDQQYLQSRIDYYSAGIDLCSTMYQKTDPILISWVIYGGGTVDKIEIDSQTAPENNNVANCLAEQIPLWKFPDWGKNSQVSYQF